MPAKIKRLILLSLRAKKPGEGEAISAPRGDCFVTSFLAMTGLLCVLSIRVYQKFLSPFLGQHCRFEPSCSHYMKLAILEFGPVAGFYAGAKRLLRCHPFSAGGFDPLPENSKA